MSKSDHAKGQWFRLYRDSIECLFLCWYFVVSFEGRRPYFHSPNENAHKVVVHYVRSEL